MADDLCHNAMRGRGQVAADGDEEGCIMRKALVVAVAVMLAGLMAMPAMAGSKRATKQYDATDRIYDQHIYGARGVRYPGDVATPVGNYHVRGGKKIPYIERCHWTFEINDLGLPWHFKQVCRRYYGKPIN